jgi:excisionase family DNA binding protein
MLAFMHTDTAPEITAAGPGWAPEDSPPVRGVLRAREAETDALRVPRPVADRDNRTENERVALSVTEVAKLLGISRALAYELVARGELPALRLGRRVVIPRVALVALLGAERL